MVNRFYVEKKEGYDVSSEKLKEELTSFLSIKGIERIRTIHGYDIEGCPADLLPDVKGIILSEGMTETISDELRDDSSYLLAVEYLPGQLDQRAQSAEKCVAILAPGTSVRVRTMNIYMFYGNISSSDKEKIKSYLINSIESRETTLELRDSLELKTEEREDVYEIADFLSFDKDALLRFLQENDMAMSLDDILFVQDYMKEENRNPTMTELKVIDTYWSDHCRHTTFNTSLDVEIDNKKIQLAYDDYLKMREEVDDKKDISLMDMATVIVKYLKKKGKLPLLDDSEENNACQLKIKIPVDGKDIDYLILFKNETHNHPTEIEPFGGAATCIGGCIRDPLSGRGYVIGGMRVTGSGDPRISPQDTPQGKLTQRQIDQKASDGYSSYGNQIGIATGLVDEIYHPGYIAKRLEVGATLAMSPYDEVRRERPEPKDKIILLGGRTGRDGIGGATGSSKTQDKSSIQRCSAQVQKGNAIEERKIQTLFKRKDAKRLIKRCNDFGAGGVSIAVGELADGLVINLDSIRKKYEGLNGTELAISESQERMAVVVSASDCDEFLKYAHEENLEAYVIAEVTEEKRVRMLYKGREIVNLSRDLLASDGAKRHQHVKVTPDKEKEEKQCFSFSEMVEKRAKDINFSNKRGLLQRFDSTIGARTLLMPLGGTRQETPIQSMAFELSDETMKSKKAVLMSYGFDPYTTEKDEYDGSYLAVVESVSKLIATGSPFKDIYLSFQEYFPKLRDDPTRWQMPMKALLGALKAQKDLSIASIGGKDSMSGSFEDMDVPPTLISFALSFADTKDIVSPEFKKENDTVYLVRAKEENNLPISSSLIAVYEYVHTLIKEGRVLSATATTSLSVIGSIIRATYGEGLGFTVDEDISLSILDSTGRGSFIIEIDKNDDILSSSDLFDVIPLGKITKDYFLSYKGERIDISKIEEESSSILEPTYPSRIENRDNKVETLSLKSDIFSIYPGNAVTPKMVIPVFPGTNCEFDTISKAREAGIECKKITIKDLEYEDIMSSIEEMKRELDRSEILFIPGGFSFADEPDGSAKSIVAFFQNKMVKDSLSSLLARGGLVGGICNGFQALIKLGLLPDGRIHEEKDISRMTLARNTIDRHQSMIVRTRIVSNSSPWFSRCKIGDIYNVPVSHGEGRFVTDKESFQKLVENSQICTQYVDSSGKATMDIRYNPNGSYMAVEGILSKDGRIFGKMGHCERARNSLYLNVKGNYELPLFESARDFFNKN